MCVCVSFFLIGFAWANLFKFFSFSASKVSATIANFLMVFLVKKTENVYFISGFILKYEIFRVKI